MSTINLMSYGIDPKKVVASITKETAEYYPGLVERLTGVIDCLEYQEINNAISSVMAAADITGHNIGYIDEAEALELFKDIDNLRRVKMMTAGIDFNYYQNYYHLDNNGELNTITPDVVMWSIVEIVEAVNY